MAGLFYQFGRMVGPKIRKGKWVLHSLTGSQADMIAAEFEVGRDMARELEASVATSSDPATASLLNEVGQRLTSRLTDRHRAFRFRAIESPEINAFALPGGFIYMTRSLLSLCQSNRDEVAFVLGHEIAHVVRGHAMDRIVNSAVVSAASRASIASPVLRSRAVQVGLDLLKNAYSQDQELESDAFGIHLAHSAGFDPRAAVAVLEHLKNKGDIAGESELLAYFSSHPQFDLRVTELNRLLP